MVELLNVFGKDAGSRQLYKYADASYGMEMEYHVYFAVSVEEK